LFHPSFSLSGGESGGSGGGGGARREEEAAAGAGAAARREAVAVTLAWAASHLPPPPPSAPPPPPPAAMADGGAPPQPPFTPLTCAAGAAGAGLLTPLCGDAPAPEGAPQADAAYATEVASIFLGLRLAECAAACKPGGSLGALAARAEEGGGGGGALRELAREEARLALHGAAHPLLALGVLHWARGVLAAPSFAASPRCLRAAAVYSRMAVFVSAAHPSAAPAALALLRAALALAPPLAGPAALRAHRAAVAATLADFALATGFAVPVLGWAAGALGGALGVPTADALLARLVAQLAARGGAGGGGADAPVAGAGAPMEEGGGGAFTPSSFSLPFALALLRFVAAVGSRKRAVAAALAGRGALPPVPEAARMALEEVLADAARLCRAAPGGGERHRFAAEAAAARGAFDGAVGEEAVAQAAAEAALEELRGLLDRAAAAL